MEERTGIDNTGNAVELRRQRPKKRTSCQDLIRLFASPRYSEHLMLSGQGGMVASPCLIW
jgi:hypothetical protein